MYVCPICGNSDKNFIGRINDTLYCRKCISFTSKGEYTFIERDSTKDSSAILKYPLSSNQNEISSKLANNIDKCQKILVYAVCGAGKTEIIVEVMEKELKKGARVGIVIPRKDLVVELGKRIKEIFPKLDVTLVYGGHHDILDGDIIVLTSHQAFRYKNHFDLLIIDEIDAFPYANNETLKAIVLRSSKGRVISLSATPSKKDLESNTVYTLFSRYHSYPLPVPKIIQSPKFLLLSFLIKKSQDYLKNDKYVFVYVPSIKEGEKLYKKLKKIFHTTFIYSSLKNKDEEMIKIRNKEYKIIITTTILERGVTYKDLQVIVYLANEYIFNKATLIQIAGRVGRVKDAPSGDVYFLAPKVNNQMREAIKEIKRYNDL